MNVLDAVVIVAGVVFAISGYRQGFIVGVATFTGFVGGGLAGMAVAARVLVDWEPGLGQAAAAVGIVLVGASIGQLLAGLMGRFVRDRLTWRPARLLDSGLGAVVSVVAVLLVTYFVASALRQAPLPAVSQQVRGSVVLGAVDEVVPPQTGRLFRSFRGMLDESVFPRVFSGLAPERILPVEPPTGQALRSPVMDRVRSSTVKVRGAADCDRRIDGSGFVFAPERVLTNAHVVAGVDEPTVQVGGTGPRYDAEVVVFDPQRDVAVLKVPGLPADPLPLEAGAGRGDEAAVVGYPLGGSYSYVPARVREQIEAQGPDIYAESEVTREVLSLFTTVEQGNSGGPLVSPEGTVYGLIFAKSIDDPQTGYALTIDEITPAVRRGTTATEVVDTGACVAA